MGSLRGRIQPTQDNALQGRGRRFESFKMESNGDVARVLFIEFGDPEGDIPYGTWAEWCHDLKAEHPDESHSGEFVGRFRCLGDPDVIDSLGVDADACPACRASMRPRRRHVTNIIVYNTTVGSTNLSKPYSVRCIPYQFTEATFGRLTELREEWGDLRKHDVRLDCKKAVWRQYDMTPLPDAAWLQIEKYPGLREQVVETYKEQALRDETQLADFIARRLPPDMLERSVQQVLTIEAGYRNAPGPKLASKDDVAAIFADDPVEATPAPAPVTPSAKSLDDLLSGA